MVACANAGADAVDTATDSLSGMTSQPSVGAVLASLEGTDLDPGLNVHHVRAIDTYWAQLRLLYSPVRGWSYMARIRKCMSTRFQVDSLTNMMFQASQLGLGAQWAETKKAYEQANDLLGDIVKVTPTSKVVGDLAQFMVSNKLNFDDVQKKLLSLTSPAQFLSSLKVLWASHTAASPNP
jgi:pyruvate carboxylase